MLVRLVLLLALIGVVLPATARAEALTGSAADARGDSASPGADLVGTDVAYDTSGDVTATLRFAAAPTATDVFAIVRVGERQADGSCSARILLATNVGPGQTVAIWSDGDNSDAASRTARGASITLQASDVLLAGSYDCLGARLTRDGDVNTTLDDGNTGALAGSAAPTPAPTATPAPTTTPAKSDPKPKATALERYDAALRRCAKRPKAKRRACRATAGRRNRAGARLAAQRRRNPLIGRVYLQVGADPGGFCGGTCIEGLSFANQRLVYTGVPEDGPLVGRCRRANAKKGRDGCRRYRRSGRTVRVAGKTYRLSRDGTKLAERKGNPFFRAKLPRVGQRIAVAVSNITSFGVPGLDQTFSSRELTFSRDGRFVATNAVTGTTGSGTDFATAFAALPADRRGTYRFETGGTLALRYSDGRVRRDSAAIGFADKGKRPRPERDGLFLDGLFHYVPD